MTGFSSAALEAALARGAATGASGDLCVAFSGGLDSTVLLAALAELRSRGWPHAVRALHIDHQLQPDSGRWSARCAETAAQLDVPFASERVVVSSASGQGVEAAARAVRYAALYGSLAVGETLLTAHHADDQLETVLLALMRGAGVRGLSGMPRSAPAGAGWHQRPLLDYPRADLERWARERSLSWIEDPTNREPRFRRSYLRHEVLPALRATWPGAAAVASRSAAHLGEAAALLDDLARLDLEGSALERCLQLGKLAAMTPARRRNLLRYWLRSLDLPVPSTAKLGVLEHDMLVARPDRQLCVDWEGAEVRLHRGLLYAGPPLAPLPVADESSWNWREPLVLPLGWGELRAVPATGAGIAVSRLPERLQWRFRGEVEGGAGGDSHDVARHGLKKLLQEARVLPWWRGRLPLLSADSELLAVGDLWIAREFAATGSTPGVRVEWRHRPPIIAVGSVRPSSGD
ncbi:MAG: tRNA lysidine(34) synthetase TilS [Steroidobacteraceae bacterium]